MRRAVDTNILVRLITRDDDAQTRKAEALVADGGLVVLPNVILETEWVLRSAFRYERRAIELGIVSLMALPQFEFVQRRQVEAAVVLYRHGMDFADALHLCAAEECDEFITFDRRMARLAGTAGHLHTPVRLV